MKVDKFKEFAIKLVNEFGEDKFSKDKLDQIWLHFWDLPDNYADQIVGWTFSMFNNFKPPTAEWIINQSKRAKSVKSPKDQEIEHSTNKDGFEKAIREMGYKSREEFYSIIGSGQFSKTKK